MTKIIKVEDCNSCPHKRFSSLLNRDVCGHSDGDCWDIKGITPIPQLCPLTDYKGELECLNQSCPNCIQS